ncbi:MAG: lamin tail domain-containing protein [Candidatus Marinimicrobia bacterium]|jgi:hypothetical protein|nr:lamin tail domain-containing protein [Candidatus Neomarinimicrobiota bacterium]|tara:strand:+ start:378 stop:1988 length:1611 start_codon:yes stop_codon:yes gene_type:complete
MGQIVITEIMYNLEGSDSPNEFVELFNISHLDTLDLSGWRIRDIYSEDTLEDSGFGLSIAPRNFALIMEGDYQLESGQYSAVIPEGTVIMKVDDSSIGNGLSASDSVYIVNSDGAIVDSVGWSESGLEGFSLERRYFEFPSVPGNWLPSLDSLGTPGLPNSVAPLETDGTLLTDSISHTPVFPSEDEDILFSIPIINNGNSTLVGSITLSETGEELVVSTFSDLEILDTLTINVTIPTQSSGRHILNIELVIANDLNSGDNFAIDTLEVSYSFGSVVFNEFLSIPDSTQMEFIELYSFVSADMEGWSFSDNTAVKRILPQFVTEPNGFIVLTGDSIIMSSFLNESQFVVPENGFPSLNNSGDNLTLFDRTGTVIDSLVYNEYWAIEDHRSTEKFRPEYTSNILSRWGVAVNEQRMTPGALNSLFIESVPTEGSVRLEPNPFSPDGDGIDDVLVIHYSLPFEQAILKVEIFNVNGISMARPVWNLHAAQEGVLTWDGFRSNGEPARIGIYAVLIAAIDETSASSWETLKTVVLAKQL